MKSILNITNGRSVVNTMKEAGISGEIITWDDVLHEGPVPCCPALEELSAVRARFIADRGWASFDYAGNKFRERDSNIKRFREFDKVVLWFEHDLYDQLQMLQILSWLSLQEQNGTEISLICTDKYLGKLSAEELKKLAGAEKTVTEDQFFHANTAWQAFCCDSPEKWQKLIKQDTSHLPFLNYAVIRLLEEYPNIGSGLSRTENQAMQAAASGIKNPVEIFRYSQKKEERIFMGDTVFYSHLKDLNNCSPPLITPSDGEEFNSKLIKEQKLTVTPTGRKVLEGEINILDIMDYDRWIGGVHLNKNNIWNWNPDSGRLNR